MTPLEMVGLWFVCSVLVVGGWVLMVEIARLRGARDITGKPFPDIRTVFTDCAQEMEHVQRDYGDETDAPRLYVLHATHSPTTPLAYLTESEWRLWADVIANGAGEPQ